MPNSGIALNLDWSEITTLISQISADIDRQGSPDVVVGILRGGMIPAVLLAHSLGIRAVQAVGVTHTTSELPNATKTIRPVLAQGVSVTELAGLDVLVVDDVAGSGQTLQVATELVLADHADRVRSAVCVVNQLNWEKANDRIAEEVVTYIGVTCRGWVSFPWERQ